MERRVWGFALCAFVGLLLTGIGLYNLRRQRRFLRRSVGAVGTVTSMVSSLPVQPLSRFGPTYVPVVRFVTTQGRAIIFMSRFSSGRRAYTVGQQVPIRYDPATPYAAQIDRFIVRWFVTLIVCGMGALWIAISLFVLLAPARSLAP